MSLWGKI